MLGSPVSNNGRHTDIDYYESGLCYSTAVLAFQRLTNGTDDSSGKLIFSSELEVFISHQKPCNHTISTVNIEIIPAINIILKS